MNLLLLLLFVVATANGHTPHFNSDNGLVTISHPHISQVYYEYVSTNKTITYVTKENETISYAQVLVPTTQNNSKCLNTTFEIIDTETNTTTYSINLGTGEITESMFEAFTQSAIDRVGDTYEGTRNVKLRLGNTGIDECRVGVVVGQEEELTAETLFAFPVITIKVWRWTWAPARYDALVGVFTMGALLYGALLAAVSGWNNLAGGFAVSFYTAVSLARMTSAIMATNATDQTSGVVFLIIFIDMIVTTLVYCACYGRSISVFLKDGVACCPTICCSCSCCIRLLEAGRTPRLIAGVGLILISLFAFSPGFYVGPACLLVSLLEPFKPSAEADSESEARDNLL